MLQAPNGEKVYFLSFGALFFGEVRGTGNYRIDPRKQFSKRLARWTAIFWFFYMTWLSCIMFIQPASALYTVYMGIIATAVMILNVWAYTRNSIYEKGVFAMLDKTKMELSLRAGNQKNNGSTETDGNEYETEEGSEEEDG